MQHSGHVLMLYFGSLKHYIHVHHPFFFFFFYFVFIVIYFPCLFIQFVQSLCCIESLLSVRVFNWRWFLSFDWNMIKVDCEYVIMLPFVLFIILVYYYLNMFFVCLPLNQVYNTKIVWWTIWNYKVFSWIMFVVTFLWLDPSHGGLLTHLIQCVL